MSVWFPDSAISPLVLRRWSSGDSRPPSPRLRWMFQKSASSWLDMYLPAPAGCVGGSRPLEWIGIILCSLVAPYGFVLGSPLFLVTNAFKIIGREFDENAKKLIMSTKRPRSVFHCQTTGSQSSCHTNRRPGIPSVIVPSVVDV